MTHKIPEIEAGNEPHGGELKEALKSNFRQLLHEWIFLQMKFIREEGLALPQLLTLRYLYYNRPRDLSSVADFMGVSKPTVTGIMNTLEREGFVKRKRDPADRRRVDLELTPKSLELFQRFEALSMFVLDELIHSVPEEGLINLNDTMSRLGERLKETIREKCDRK